ncbi:MAG: arsenate reductase family protein [Bdellovibrionales bacterium]
MFTVLGIPNCSTVKKARIFLDQMGVDYNFRDLKKEPLDKDSWAKIIEQDDSNLLINTRGPSFRALNIDKENLNPSNKLKALMENASCMKRPLVLKKNKIYSIGFKEEQYKELFK